jgi:hypothetical protein
MIPSASLFGRKRPSLRVQLHDKFVSKIGNPVTVSYALQSGGNAVNQDSVVLENWLLPGMGPASDFECRATVVSGSLSSGTTGSWNRLDVTRAWTRSHSGASGESDCELTIEIGLFGQGVALVTATITLTADSGA